MTRIHGYQRPPRGGRGICRRACERTPLRGRRRCAAGGRLDLTPKDRPRSSRDVVILNLDVNTITDLLPGVQLDTTCSCVSKNYRRVVYGLLYDSRQVLSYYNIT
jgi:hypothetical protein